MRPNTTIQSLLAGLVLFTFGVLGTLAKLGAFVVIITHFFPGLILGIILMTNYGNAKQFKPKFIFVILSTVIYIICAFFVNVAHEQEVMTSIRLLIASSVGFVLLTLSFYLLFTRKINVRQTILLPFIIGLISSLLSAFCMYYLHYLKFDQKILEALTWAGIFSIFPIWYSLFTLNIKSRGTVEASTGLAEN